MIKSTLVAIPNYSLSLFMILLLVANKKEAMLRNLLWNDDPNHHWYHFVKWEKICNPVHNGVVGIRDLKSHNIALLAKWLWRFGLERYSLWHWVVAARFVEFLKWES